MCVCSARNPLVSCFVGSSFTSKLQPNHVCPRDEQINVDEIYTATDVDVELTTTIILDASSTFTCIYV